METTKTEEILESLKKLNSNELKAIVLEAAILYSQKSKHEEQELKVV